MATRKKKTIISGVTREAAEAAFGQYAKADAQINKINAEIELACAKIREKHADKLAALSNERDQAFETLQSFATENRAELFTKKKSLDMAHGTIGFRTGTPKLKTLKGFRSSCRRSSAPARRSPRTNCWPTVTRKAWLSRWPSAVSR